MKKKLQSPCRSNPADCSALRILRLTLKRKWFDMIASGEKKEEYREPSHWILSRLTNADESGSDRKYDLVEFRNGYAPDAPTVVCEYLGWEWGQGRTEWGGGSHAGSPLAVIKLGSIIPQNAPGDAPPHGPAINP